MKRFPVRQGVFLAASLVLSGCELLTDAKDSSSPEATSPTPVVIAPSASPHTIGSVADSRFGTTWTLDGTEMTSTRAKLLAAANFGPSGTVPYSLTISDTAASVGSITPTLLAGYRIFFIGWFNTTGTGAFTAAELSTLAGWVKAGGVLIVTSDDLDHSAVAQSLGFTPSQNDAADSASPVGPIVATKAGSQPGGLFDGPFGTVTSATLQGNFSYFTAYPPSAPVLGVDQNGKPVVLEQSLGAGRLLVLGDVDLISSYNSTVTAGTGIASDNDRFLGNLFSYAVSLAGG